MENEQNCNILTSIIMAISVVSFLFPGAHSAGCGLSVLHLVINSSDLQLTDFLSSPSYIIVQSSIQYLWNGMFDRHQAEINFMQFTGHSLPVHQSRTVPWDFTLSHIVSQAHLRQWNMQLPRLWNGMSGWVEGQYTTTLTVEGLNECDL